MNDYCNGIAYATGYIAKERNVQYLVVRNIDSWYPYCISEATGFKVYKCGYHEKHLSTEQWIVKARNIYDIPPLSAIRNIPDFCRSYIEIHGVLDTSKRKNNRRGLRLRIFGKEDVIHFINISLPAMEKKIQYVKNKIDNKYTGETYVIYYQSRAEIGDILNYLDGYPKNVRIWKHWNQVIQSI